MLATLFPLLYLLSKGQGHEQSTDATTSRGYSAPATLSCKLTVPKRYHQRPLLFLDCLLIDSTFFTRLACIFFCPAHAFCNRCIRTPAKTITPTTLNCGRFSRVFRSGVTPISSRRRRSTVLLSIISSCPIVDTQALNWSTYQALNISICNSKNFFSYTRPDLNLSSLTHLARIHCICFANPLSSAACLFSFSFS